MKLRTILLLSALAVSVAACSPDGRKEASSAGDNLDAAANSAGAAARDTADVAGNNAAVAAAKVSAAANTTADKVEDAGRLARRKADAAAEAAKQTH